MAVTRLALLRSLDTLFAVTRHGYLSHRYSAWIALSQSLGSISRGHSTRSLSVTRLALCGYSSWIALSQLLGADRSLAVPRIDLSQSLGLLASLEHDVIPRRHVHPLSIDTSSMATCSDGSEHSPHRSFAQPSRSKKSDRNQKYVDDSSPETAQIVLSSLDRSFVTRPFCHHSIVLSSLDRSVVTRRRSFSRSHSTRSLAVTRCISFSCSRLARSLTVTRSISSLGADRSFVTRPFYRHLTVLSSLDRSVITRSLCRHSTVLSSLGADLSLAVARLDLSRSLGADHSRTVAWLDLSRSLARSPHSVQIVRSLVDRSVVTRPFCHQSTVLSSLDCSVVTRPFCHHSIILSSLDRSVVTRCRSFSRGHSVQIVLAQSLGSISRGHSLDLLTRRMSFSRSRSIRSLAVARHDLSQSLGSISRSQSLALLTRRRSYSAQIVLSQSHGSLSRSLDSVCRGHSFRSLAVTRLALCGYSSWIALSQLLGLDRSIAVTRIVLSGQLFDLRTVNKLVNERDEDSSVGLGEVFMLSLNLMEPTRRE
ncbi:hypothetical protein YC2023_052356 [Brassica napus]